MPFTFQDFAIDVLGASTTRREAKSYLSRFQLRNEGPSFKQRQHQTLRQTNNTVNLGNLFEPIHAGEIYNPHSDGKDRMEPRHVAIVLLRAPDQLSNEVLHGVTRTLSQLSQLGMHCVVMLDLRDYLSVAEQSVGDRPPYNEHEARRRHQMLYQADRILDALESHLNQRARRLDYLFKVEELFWELPQLLRGRISPQVENMHLLEQCLDSGAIPIVLPLVRSKSLRMRPIHTKQAVLALSRALAGTAQLTPIQGNVQEQISRLGSNLSSSDYSVERIIVLDSGGGIPAGPSFKKAHVFINLEQEYNDIKDELNGILKIDSVYTRPEHYPIRASASQHLKNLSLAKRALKFLPPTSSALITSPEAVARYEYSSNRPRTSDVGTRTQRNILIHNILTNKPIRSSSLPPSRLADTSDETFINGINLSTTFLKHGMPITIIPDPKIKPWNQPVRDMQVLSIQDPRLDIGRLIHLIQDSFGRPLNSKHYFSRIAPSLAGIIVAGAYEGGAVLTWERVPTVKDTDPPRFVPYLDKFAVLKRSQGSGGVADILFNAMVQDCFPQGVCWRSRSDNPVNKWYFERARGTYQLAPKDGENQSWTMFWTTEGIEGQRFKDYEDVCRSITSSWADQKQKLD